MRISDWSSYVGSSDLDPSNVRLLRVALDLWPARQLLEEVLKLFEPYLVGKIRAVTSRQVAYYCLAEIFRAGATETGFIDDPECLPAAVNLDGYRSLLLEAAIRVAQGEAERVPWYLAQQTGRASCRERVCQYG